MREDRNSAHLVGVIKVRYHIGEHIERSRCIERAFGRVFCSERADKRIDVVGHPFGGLCKARHRIIHVCVCHSHRRLSNKWLRTCEELVEHYS